VGVVSDTKVQAPVTPSPISRMRVERRDGLDYLVS